MIQIQGLSLDFAPPARVPMQWRPIATSADPDARCAAALALWPRDFLELVPKFAGRLADQLTDVRAYLTDTDPVLVYEAGEVVWIGSDPRTFTTPPPFWDRLPRPAQDFQREVHAGFTGPDGESHGLMHPAHLQTIAERAGSHGVLLPFDDYFATEREGWIASNRLLRITRDYGNLWLCISPDLPLGQVAMEYEGYVNSEDFTGAFDDLMVGAFEVG